MLKQAYNDLWDISIVLVKVGSNNISTGYETQLGLPNERLKT